MKFFSALSVLIYGVCVTFFCSAQEMAVNEHSIESTALNETQKFSVFLPSNYHESPGSQYPVLYVLDGKYYKNLVSSVISSYARNRLIPDTIVVAIENDDRVKHYTPSPHKKVDVPSGGADKFLDYIEHELIPFVDAKYQTSEFRILKGHSLGGLLSLYALQARPELFSAHYALSPSLGWGDRKTVAKVKSYLSSRKELKQFLYLNLGDEGYQSQYANRRTMRNEFTELQAYLTSNIPAGFRVKSEILETLPHATTNITGLVHATNELYRYWSLPFHVMERGPEAISQHYQALSDDLHYQVKPSMDVVNYAADFMTNGVSEPEKGIAILEYNAQLYPDSAWVQFNLASGYKRSNEAALAKQYANKALSLVGDNDEDLKTAVSEFLQTL